LSEPLSKELYIHDIDVFVNLRASLLSSDSRDDTQANSIAYIEAFLDRAISEVERRYAEEKRIQSYRGWGNRWPQRPRLVEMKAIAQEIKGRITIVQYLEQYVPWTTLYGVGDRMRGRCPFPDHDDKTASFTIFPDDHAWCFGCRRGGDLFRIVALIEGIPVFRHQLRFVADLLDIDTGGPT
jgi:hypothetical protein